MVRRLKRLVLFTLVFLASSGAGIYVVYDQVAGQRIAFDRALLSPRVVLAAALLLVVYHGADGLRLRHTLAALGWRLPLGAIVRLVFINLFVSNVTPLATGGGVAQIVYLRGRGVPVGTATAATTLRTVLAVLFIFTAAPASFLLLGPSEGVLSGGRIVLYLALGAVAYVGFFGLVLLRTRWVVGLQACAVAALLRAHLIGAARSRRWRWAGMREALHFAHGFRRYLRGPRRDVSLSVLYTLVFLVSLFSFPAVLLWGLGYQVAYFVVIGLVTLTTFVMYFSPTPGAAGFAEGAFGYLFADLVAEHHLVLVIVAWRLLTIYLGMVVGLFVTQHELAQSIDRRRSR